MTELYGGAITIKKLPSTFIDVSNLRQIPDNQEVFINQTTQENPNLDKSLIIDILEKLNSNYQIAIIEHLSDIYPNPNSNQLIENEKDRFISMIKFKPEYPKIDPLQPKEIISLIGLIRLDNVETDILIQYNIPFDKEIEIGIDNIKNQKDYILFKEIVQSFKINDWNLFG